MNQKTEGSLQKEEVFKKPKKQNSKALAGKSLANTLIQAMIHFLDLLGPQENSCDWFNPKSFFNTTWGYITAIIGNKTTLTD